MDRRYIDFMKNFAGILHNARNPRVDLAHIVNPKLNFAESDL